MVAGQDANFSVAATGTAPLAYQWKRGGIALSGATGATYRLAAASAQDGGATFTVDVSNSAGTVSSSPATLTVSVPPTIAAQPRDITLPADQAATFTVTANGTAPLVYQWKRNGTAIAGATTASLTLSPATAANNGARFTVDVTNLAGTVTSTAAVVRISPPLALLAGVLGGFGNLDGSTANARIGFAAGMTVDANGTLLFVDSSNMKVRSLDPSATEIRTVAGSGIPGSADGAATTSRFKFNSGSGGVAADGNGNLYVLDSGNSTIRKITPAGVVSTLAGVANTVGFSDGAGALALFRNPDSIVYAQDGHLYVTDTGNNAIRRVTLAGVVTTVAGAPTAGSANGVGTAARFSFPTAIAACSGAGLCATGPNSSFSIYVADSDNNTIRQIAVAGAVGSQTYTTTTFAGAAGVAGAADGANAVARFDRPFGLALDRLGLDLYVADTGNNTIRKITGNVVTTIAGTADQPGSATGTGAAARFGFPTKIYPFTRGGAVGVVVSDDSRLRHVSSTGVVTNLAGSVSTAGTADGAGTAARFTRPLHVASDASGNLYVADALAQTVRKITSAGVVTTFAGAGTASAGQFPSPFGVAVDSSGVIWVTNLTSTIRKITPAGVVSAFSGTNAANAPATIAAPDAIAADNAGNLYVTDNCAVRKISATGVISTLAGGTCGYADGVGSAAMFGQSRGIAVDAAGNVYVADSQNYLVRKITPAGAVSTLAGSPGATGFVDGIASAARFGYLFGVAVDASGNVYVADSSNSVVRQIAPNGTVTTVVGRAGSLGNQPGPLPGSLAGVFGLAFFPGSNSLAITDSFENVVLTASFP